MKRTLSKLLICTLVASSVMALSAPIFAETGTDGTTSATAKNWTETKSNGTTTTKQVIPEGADVYVVKSGDMVWKIAKAYGLTIDELLKLNPNIKNANMIYAGQKLIVKLPKVEKEVAMDSKEVSGVLYHGLGQQSNFRARGENYSVNITMASAIFDEEGRIIDVYVDTYEVTQSSNFAGWPGTNEEITLESATAQTAEWQTKREKGDAYGMAARATTGNEWYVQMNNYQEFFKGKTVAEIRAWFDKSTGATGKPIVATTEDEAEKAKLAMLSEEEKEELADVITSATMSLSDSHAHIIEAIEEAYANRVKVEK